MRYQDPDLPEEDEMPSEDLYLTEDELAALAPFTADVLVLGREEIELGEDLSLPSDWQYGALARDVLDPRVRCVKWRARVEHWVSAPVRARRIRGRTGSNRWQSLPPPAGGPEEISIVRMSKPARASRTEPRIGARQRVWLAPDSFDRDAHYALVAVRAPTETDGA